MWGAFPAHAGMNRTTAPRRRCGTCVPRTRGDEPAGGADYGAKVSAFPAHAGMNRRTNMKTITVAGVPRTRGDEPYDFDAQQFGGVRSPHTRG